jgi:hypothetical protein
MEQIKNRADGRQDMHPRPNWREISRRVAAKHREALKILEAHDRSE